MQYSIYVMYKLRFLYKLQLIQRACTSCNLYKQFVQVATHTRLAVQVVTCTEFHHQINPTCTILLYKLDVKKNFVYIHNFIENISDFMCINIQINVRLSYVFNFSIKN